MDAEIESVWWLSSNHEIGSNASRSGGCLHLTARDLGQTFSTQDLGPSKAFPPKVKLKVTDHRASAGMGPGSDGCFKIPKKGGGSGQDHHARGRWIMPRPLGSGRGSPLSGIPNLRQWDWGSNGTRAFPLMMLHDSTNRIDPVKVLP